MFQQIPGNDQIKQYLTRLIQQNTIPHLLLFAGPRASNKEAFAETFAKALIQTDKLSHPDLLFFSPEGKIGMHSIESMRQFSKEVYLSPYQAPYKLFVIHDAERMLATSANAVLKTLEEPAPQSVIILLSSRPENLLPTVVSRCQTVRFHAQNSEILSDEDRAHPLRLFMLNLLAQGSFQTYTELLQSATSLCQQDEEMQTKLEEAMREELERFYPEGAGTVQQQAIEKEIDGAKSIQQMHEMQRIFDAIFTWYRDLQLLSVQGKRDYLVNRDYLEQLEKALHRGEGKPLEQIQQIIEKVRISLERSGSLSSCIENLFLQILT